MYPTLKPLSRLLLAGVAALPLLGSLATPVQAQSSLLDGMKAYWNFNDGTPNDSAGGAVAYDGTPIGEPTYEPGKFGSSLQLSGTGQAIEISGGEPDDLAFAGESMSLSIWFKSDGFDKSWQALVAKGEGANWRFHRRDAGNGLAFTGGAAGDTPAGAENINDGQWHHAVAISDKDNNKSMVYIDGVLSATLNSVGALSANGKRMMIGENPDARSRYWKGGVDDLALWNRPLTEEEVVALWNNGDGKEIKSFFLTEPTVEILGIGTAALLGSPLTDPEGDGNEAAGNSDPSWNGNVFFASHKAFFNGGEGSFNVFDHKVGGGDDKMCCDDPTVANPVFVGVNFPRAASITHFTMASGNDTPGRDPRRWKLQGSNDNNTWEDIFVQDSDTPLWTARNQVIKITLGAPSAPYSSIRYIVTDTAEPLHQLNEIELFGRFGGASIPRFAGARASRTQIFINIADGLDTTLNAATVSIKIDGASVSTTSAKNNTTTTFTYTHGSKYEPASVHTLEITGKDSAGNDLNFSGTVKIPVPWFPDSDLPSPDIAEGLWSTRYIFASGTLNSIPDVLARINAIGAGTFETDFPDGKYYDTTSEVLNHGNGGFFGSPIPYDQGAIDLGGCCVDDFTLFSVGNIRIPADGTYTFGVHSDDGFAMRIRGGKAISVSGNGELDPADPEAVVHPANTGDSNTRGVYELKAGVYRIEFFWWERGGGDHGELYAAQGSFANDADSASWKLIGDPTPGETYIKLGVDADGWSVVSSEPGGDPINNWAGAQLDLDAGVSAPVVYNRLNVGDPDTNGGVDAFPRNAVGDQDDFVLKATAKLVVPEDGTYSIGFNSDDGAYMKIAGQTFTELTVNGTGASKIDDAGDSVTCDCLTGDSATVATITLAKGVYPIEVGMFERGGGAFLAARGAQLGAPQLPILEKNGTGTFSTGDSLKLTSEPVSGSGNKITKIELVGNNAVITFRPAAAGTYKIEQSSNLSSWTALTITPVAAGSDLVFTVPRQAGAVFFRINQ